MTNQSPDYRAGLEAAAGICDENLKYWTENGSNQHASASAACAEDIRALIKQQSQPQEVQPVACNNDMSYEDLQKMYFAQCQLTDEWAAKYKAAIPEGCVIAPHYRGYAVLGSGQYLLLINDAPKHAELVISIATEDEKEGRVIGDFCDAPSRAIQPDEMCVRLRFSSVEGLNALEKQLHLLRKEHFPETYDPASLTAAGFASVEDLLAAWQGAQKDAALLHSVLKFTNDCINDSFEGCDIYGCEIQDRAASVGLLREETMTKECGEHCSCSDVTSFPTTCYRKTYLHLIASVPAPEPKP